MNGLSAETIATIKATAPLVGAHAPAIIRRMYERMFAANPEVAPFFNPAHMTEDRQIRSLAEALAAYGANIDNLGALGPAVERIAQKHVALQIRPEHYPIVGGHLLAAVVDILGAAVTPEVARAWFEAYNFLAGIFIARERELYAEKAAQTGGWDGLRPFRVVRKQPESSLITSFYLQPADGEPVPTFRPGQYVTVHLPELTDAGRWRNYSLSDRPGHDYLRITVKREPAASGHGSGIVSNHLHDAIKVGDTLQLVAPSGHFGLEGTPTRPVVLLSGGVGVTPMLSLWNHLAETDCPVPVYFVHAAANSLAHACGAEVDRVLVNRPLFRRHVHYRRPTESCIPQVHYDSTGLLDVNSLRAAGVPLDSDFYLCGPAPFLRSLYLGLVQAGVPRDQIHHEFFGPESALTS